MTAPALTQDELAAWAAELWRTLPPHAVVWLTGPLGAGKTTFVQAVVDAAGGEGASSPTYALVHEYMSPAGVLAHVDCYRLRHEDEALDLDFPDLQRRARAVFVEWPERGGAYVPPPQAHLHFEHGARSDVRIVERRR